MAAVCGGVILDVSRNNHRTSVKSKTFNTSSRKKKGCFGWLRFWKRKKASTMQTQYKIRYLVYCLKSVNT